MDNIQFLTQFVSKDKTREVITGIYRDKNAIVATDGHAMAWIETKSESSPGYVDGQDRGQYPDWRCVLLKKDHDVIATFNAAALIKKLKFLARDNAVLKLIIEKDQLKIKTLEKSHKFDKKYKMADLGYQLQSTIATVDCKPDSIRETPAIAADYLIKTLETIVDRATFKTVELEFDCQEGSPIVINHDDRHVLIMPMKQS